MSTSEPRSGRVAGADAPREDLREASVGELVKRLTEDAGNLVRQEIQLAKTEMTEKGKQAGKGAGMLGAAAVVGLLAAGVLTAFLVLVLDTFMPTWLAALIVGLVYLAIAAFLALRGKKALVENKPVPEQTIETVKEDVEWLKSQR
jgi:uncharacterized membrane protein YqjE